MSRQSHGVHICSFIEGIYSVQSPRGGQGFTFEDSDQFGPSKLNLRTGEPMPISERHRWFWEGYARWRVNGRPTTGQPISTPYGEIKKADFTCAGVSR